MSSEGEEGEALSPPPTPSPEHRGVPAEFDEHFSPTASKRQRHQPAAPKQPLSPRRPLLQALLSIGPWLWDHWRVDESGAGLSEALFWNQLCDGCQLPAGCELAARAVTRQCMLSLYSAEVVDAASRRVLLRRRDRKEQSSNARLAELQQELLDSLSREWRKRGLQESNNNEAKPHGHDGHGGGDDDRSTIWVSSSHWTEQLGAIQEENRQLREQLRVLDADYQARAEQLKTQLTESHALLKHLQERLVELAGRVDKGNSAGELKN